MAEYSPERVFASHKGLHIEFKSRLDAREFYREGIQLGSRVELHGHLVIMLTSKYLKSRAPD